MGLLFISCQGTVLVTSTATSALRNGPLGVRSKLAKPDMKHFLSGNKIFPLFVLNVTYQKKPPIKVEHLTVRTCYDSPGGTQVVLFQPAFLVNGLIQTKKHIHTYTHTYVNTYIRTYIHT